MPLQGGIFEFDATFNTPATEPGGSPQSEESVFLSKVPSTFYDDEWGVLARFDNSGTGNGNLYGFIQEGTPVKVPASNPTVNSGVTQFQIVLLQANDLQPHHFTCQVTKDAPNPTIAFSIDGVLKNTINISSNHLFSNQTPFTPVMNCNRLSDPWNANGAYLLAGNITLSDIARSVFWDQVDQAWQ
jgi:hypothetical protein